MTLVHDEYNMHIIRQSRRSSQELLTDPDCAPESAKSVSSHARDGVINLRENPSTISSLVLLLGLSPDSPRNWHE